MVVTIGAVDVTKSIIIASAKGYREQSGLRARIINSTQIGFLTSCDVYNYGYVQWYVIEFASGVNVQRGDVNIPYTSDASISVTISAVDLNKSILLHGLALNSDLVSYPNMERYRSRFGNSTTLVFEKKAYTGVDLLTHWQVISFS